MTTTLGSTDIRSLSGRLPGNASDLHQCCYSDNIGWNTQSPDAWQARYSRRSSSG